MSLLAPAYPAVVFMGLVSVLFPSSPLFLLMHMFVIVVCVLFLLELRWRKSFKRVYIQHLLVVLLSEVDNVAKNADVASQATSLPNIIVDGIDLTSESFTLFYLTLELLGKYVFL